VQGDPNRDQSTLGKGPLSGYPKDSAGGNEYTG